MRKRRNPKIAPLMQLTGVGKVYIDFRRRRHTLKPASAVPKSASVAGSGTPTGEPEPQFGVPMVQSVPTCTNSEFGGAVVPKLKVTEVIVVAAVMAESSITNVPVWLIKGEKVPLVIEPFPLL